MKRKILFLHPRLVIGGAEAVLINYLNLAVKNKSYDIHLVLFESMEKVNLDKIDPNVKVHFLLTPIETQFSRYCYSSLQDDQQSASEKSYYQHWDYYIDEKRRERLIDYINTEKIDVIIDFMNTIPLYLTEAYLDKISQPILYWIHSDSQFTTWTKNKEWYRTALDKAHTSISICEDMQKKCELVFSHYLGLTNGKTAMLFNPLDNQKIEELSKLEVDDKDALLLADDFILQVARLDEQQKNHLQMIDIYSKLKKKGIKEKLYIIGDGNVNILREKINQLGLEKDCLLLGSRINPFPFMKQARLFIHTAKFEGFGMVLVESMICGTPVVAFNCPTGPREILADGKYGGLIPMGDEAQFVETAYQLLTDNALRQHYIQLLPEAVDRFSMDNITKQFVTLIDNLFSDK